MSATSLIRTGLKKHDLITPKRTGRRQLVLNFPEGTRYLGEHRCHMPYSLSLIVSKALLYQLGLIVSCNAATSFDKLIYERR